MNKIIAVWLLLMPAFSGSMLSADEAHDQAAKSIEESGGAVRKIAADDDRVEVDFHLIREDAKDEHLSPIPKLSGVYRVHLGGTGVSDEGLKHLKGMDSIEYLHLERTKVTDAGLDVVAGLKTLTYLNLYGTAISDAGLKKLSSLENLQKLYVWQTKVTDKGIEALQAKLPDVKIEKGWDTADLETPEKKEEAEPDP